MTNLTYQCPKCAHRFEKPPIYREAVHILCPSCNKKFTPDLLLYFRREWLEPICFAIVAALFIKRMFFELYVIPTSSMEPALHGAKHYPEDGGDKVFVDKTHYLFSDPENWDVIVFKPPHIETGQLYIKRLIGKPNQEIKVLNGDVFVDGKVKRRPESVLESMLYTVYDSKVKNEDFYLSHFSDFQSAAWLKNNFVEADNLLSFKGEEGSLTFNHPIDTRIESHKETKWQIKGNYHYEAGHSAWEQVGDVAIDGLIKFSADTDKIVFTIAENKESPNESIFQFEIKPTEKKIRILKNMQVLGEQPLNKLDDWFHFDVRNIDNLISFKLGDIQMEFEDPKPNESRTYSVGVKIECVKGEMSLKDMRIRRDIFYFVPSECNLNRQITPDENGVYTYKLGPDDYMCFGDNVHQSSDSRDWGFTSRKSIKGKALLVLMPLRLWLGDDLPPPIPFISHRTRTKIIR